MPSAFSGLNIALTALSANRKAIDVTAHNVANANTDGYTRQEAVMTAVYLGSAVVAERPLLGCGVDVDSIRRMRDSFLDHQVRGQTSTRGRWETTSSYLEEVEAVFNEPSESGFNSFLAKMWASWHELSASPESFVTRMAVIQSAGLVTDVLRRNATQLAELRQEASRQIGLEASEINGWLREIADLNGQIQKVRIVGDDANDLADRRDLLLDRLARAIDVGYEERQDGTIAIWLGSRGSGTEQTLVEGSRYGALRVDESSGAVLWESGDPPATAARAIVEDGELAALLEVQDHTLNPEEPDSLAGRFHSLARALVGEVNSLHNPSGDGDPFFIGTGASDISVNPALVSDPTLVRAGASETAGDGDVALAVAQLQSRRVLSGGTATIGDTYTVLITTLGAQGQRAKTMVANQSLLVENLIRNRESYSGVSLDEEAANLIRFERSYQAAARVMTAMDEMLDRIVNGLGIVGR